MDSRLSDFLARAESVLARLEPLLPAVREAVDWERSLAARWHRDGRSGYLQPLEVSLDLRLADLLGVERQREQLERNTRQFVAGQPANHALLWGPRDRQVLSGSCAAGRAGRRRAAPDRDRARPPGRPAAGGRATQGLPQRFVLFCDDLSFDAGEGDYRVLKSVLDGSLEQAPDNVLLYATSNRRHLVSEKQSDNENWKMVDGELHPNEAVEDKIALSDRFGLWLSFYPFTQEHFLSVVRHCGRARGEGRAGLELERGTGEGSDPLGAWPRQPQRPLRLSVLPLLGGQATAGAPGMIDLQQSGAGLAGYALLAAQAEALFADERDFIANAAQFSAFP